MHETEGVQELLVLGLWHGLEESKLSEGPIFCLSNFGLGAVCVRCAKPHALGRVERRKPAASLLPVLSERWAEGRRDAHGHGSPGH